MSRVEPEPDLGQTHSSLVQLIMQGCRQHWQDREGRQKKRGDDETKESQRDEGREDMDDAMTRLETAGERGICEG